MTSSSNNISPYRQFIVDALARADDGEHLNAILKYAPVDDYSLCQEILYGITRWKGTLQKMIRLRAKKNPKLAVRRILYLALYELYWLNKPAHAVLDQAVRICKSGKYKHQANFVNALLRQMTPPTVKSNVDNFPAWLLEMWGEHQDWLQSLQRSPYKTLVFKNTSDALQSELDLIPATILGNPVEGVYHCQTSGRITEWSGYEQGDWWVMNPASVHVVDKVWAVSQSKSHTERTVLDLCAAPGGKSFRFVQKGARVVSVDASADRLSRMQSNLDRLELNTTLWQKDLTEYHEDLGVHDIVFLDAPCSGLGVIRKHPEIRWNRTQADVLASALRQRQILHHAQQYVKEGGILAYCVCSLHPMEGEHVAGHFLKLNPSWNLYHQWSTPIEDPRIERELLDGFQVFIFKKSEVPYVDAI